MSRHLAVAATVRATARTALMGAVLAPLLVACAAPSHEKDAQQLRDRLGELAGVESVELSYSEPVTLDSGKLSLDVTMRPDASPQDVVALVGETYEAFSDEHQGEEGDLEVAFGDDSLHLRSFEPTAETDDVRDAARRAVDLFGQSRTRVVLMTQDVADAPHVSTEIEVAASGPGADAVLETLTALEKEHGTQPLTSWTVLSPERPTYLLGSTVGFPSAERRALFAALSGTLASLPGSLADQSGVEMNEMSVTVMLPAATTDDDAVSVAAEQLQILAAHPDDFYDLNVGSSTPMSWMPGDCSFTRDPLGRRLEQAHAAACPASDEEDSGE